MLAPVHFNQNRVVQLIGTGYSHPDEHDPACAGYFWEIYRDRYGQMFISLGAGTRRKNFWIKEIKAFLGLQFELAPLLKHFELEIRQTSIPLPFLQRALQSLPESEFLWYQSC